MCVEEGHSLRDCPETKAFIMKKVLKYTNEGWLIKFDGSDLPHSDMNNAGVTQILQQQIPNASNLKMNWLLRFNSLNQEFAKFGEYEYNIFLAEQAQSHGQKQSEPYDKDDPKGKWPEQLNRAYVEVPKKDINDPRPTSSGTPTLSKQETHASDQPVSMKQLVTILKCDVPLPEEDVVMGDSSPENPQVHDPL
jgi:hypothetical protein